MNGLLSFAELYVGVCNVLYIVNRQSTSTFKKKKFLSLGCAYKFVRCGMQAWFRELPRGVLDSLSPEQVLGCHGEKDSLALTKQLPLTEAALLNWAVNLMADVVEHESYNKMNARNIAMVFAPNMTQV